MLDILFINTNDNQELRNETNGTMLLATALLQKDFSVDILRFCQIDSYMGDYNVFIQDITNRIIEINPKCISFYTLWPYYHIILRIAREIKKRNSKIYTILGGPQSSATAYDTMQSMEFIDFICTGEGENTVVPFFSALLDNDNKKLVNIPGFFYRNNGEVFCNSGEIPITDLDALPYWDDRLYIINENKNNLTSPSYFMPIDVGRGCPFSCTFCSSSLFWKRKYRMKSPKRIIQDIEFYNKKFGISSFSFSHDAFTCNNRLVLDVCNHIIEKNLNITWKCTARIDCITEDLILKMKKSGMTHIELGIETGSDRMQKLINKKLDLSNAKNMIAFLLKEKISVALFFMYGFPEETTEDLNQTLYFLFNVVDMGCNYASMSFCKFNAMTFITNKYFNELVLNDDISLLRLDIFGYQEEYNMIEENKSIFPHFYHLNTELRNEYQHLSFLCKLYQKFPNSIRYLRSLYKGDNIQFYKDFYNNNIKFFNTIDMLHTGKSLKENSIEIFSNTIKGFRQDYVKKIISLLEYDYDLQKVSHSKEDISIKKSYDFSYIEYQMGLPIEQFTDKKTEILIEKINGKFNKKILSIDI